MKRILIGLLAVTMVIAVYTTLRTTATAGPSHNDVITAVQPTGMIELMPTINNLMPPTATHVFYVAIEHGTDGLVLATSSPPAAMNPIYTQLDNGIIGHGHGATASFTGDAAMTYNTNAGGTVVTTLISPTDTGATAANLCATSSGAIATHYIIDAATWG